MLIPKFEDLDCPGKLGKAYISKNFSEFYEYLIQRYQNYNNTKFSELLYCYYNNIDIHPVCPVCKKETVFLDRTRGYQKYCSLKCSNSDQIVKEKKIQTNIERFGVPHAAQNDQIKQKQINTTVERYGGCGNASDLIKEKQFKTMIDRYGVKVFTQNEQIKQKVIQTCTDKYGGMGAGSPIIKEKIINTNINKYGNECALLNENIRAKIKETNLNKYGVVTPSQNKIISEKISNTKCKNYQKNHNYLIDVYTKNDITYYKVQCPHPECNLCENKYYIIPASTYFDRKRDKTELCTIKLPVQQYRGKDTSIELFIRDVLDKHSIEYQTNVKNIISPKELDIYIPSKNIAIECNGCYWHSSYEKPNNYHVNKYKECKKKDIQLISIWEDWVKMKPKIVESIILSKLGIYKERIYARKCIIKELDSKTCSEFLNENHIQGKQNSIIKLGLYYNNELVSVMNFCKKRGGMGNKEFNPFEWELSRFCNKLNTDVIGGASKLLKYFIETWDPSSIISFSMNDISNGGLYEKLGFKCDNNIIIPYWYIKDNIRYHRLNYTKSAILSKGLVNEQENTNWTEFDVMEKLGFLRIYDSGQLKWILNLENN